MKKIFLAILSAMLLFAACGKEDIVNDSNYLNDDVEIVFQSNFGTAPATKAIINNIADLDESEFNVFGYIHASDNPNIISGGIIMNNATYKIKGEGTDPNKIYKATASDGKSYFWPKSDVNDIKANFVALYPTGSAALNSNEITYTIKANSTPVKAANLTSANNKDVLWATVYKVSPVLNQYKQGRDTISPIALKFKHALSLLEFQANVLGDNNILKVEIEKIELLDANGNLAKLDNEGTLKINLNDNTKGDNTLYSETYVPTTNIISDDDSKKVTISNFVIAGANEVNMFGEYCGEQVIPQAKATVLSNTIVLPQSVPQSVRLTFNIFIKNGDNGDEVKYYGRTVTRSIRADGTNPGNGYNGQDETGKIYKNTWEAGNKYIYRFIIGADDIEFTVTVDDWVVTNNDFLVWDKE